MRFFILALLVPVCFADEAKIRAAADKVLAEVKHNSNITADLIVSFSAVESSHKKDVLGDYDKKSKEYKAYGLFQFHKARWIECGGTKENYRNADIETQVRIMVNALNRYCKSNRKGVECLRWMATSHNIGHGVDKETAYVKKIRKGL